MNRRSCRSQTVTLTRDIFLGDRLKAAGAVLVAKLATGEMATGDEWWGGKTKCPWNIAVGASGSSAGKDAIIENFASAFLPFF